MFENGENFHSLFPSFIQWERYGIWTCSNLFRKSSPFQKSWGGKNLPILSDLKDHKENFLFRCSWNVEVVVSSSNRGKIRRTIDIDEENSNFNIIFRKMNKLFETVERSRARKRNAGQPTSIFHLVWKKRKKGKRKACHLSENLGNFHRRFSTLNYFIHLSRDIRNI